MTLGDDDGSYPRPLLRRDRWQSLDGAWGFAFDDADAGVAQRWYEPTKADVFARTINVPFPPEAPASGVGDRGFHPVIWYRREIARAQTARNNDARVLVHFGAVDFCADVWCDGRHVSRHVGGQTPFTADITDALSPAVEKHVIVVRAADDPHDREQPRGKQDWEEQPHDIWYERTSGIWQSVWTETVPAQHMTEVTWRPDVAGSRVHAEIVLARTPTAALRLEVTMALGDEVLAVASADAIDRTAVFQVPVPALARAKQRARLLWSPDRPVLVDVRVLLRDGRGAVIDEISSYLGLRTVTATGGAFQLNGRRYPLRAVLNQGYRPETHLATTGTEELRCEVELARAMGFNAVRLHQKAEDPRFLYWADRLGLLVWCETAAAYRFSARAVGLLTREWTELVRRYRGHPSLVTWVPINESWGVPDIATEPAQQHFARSIAALTRALDPSRPVLSNEGWEHVDSDILGVHDYAEQPRVLRRRYGSKRGLARLRKGRLRPAGRALSVTREQRHGVATGQVPIMLTEFGGVSMAAGDKGWGYATVQSERKFGRRLRELFGAVRASRYLDGFCYTQFRDTGLETNGLLRADGTPKLPLATIHEIVTGRTPETQQ